MSTSQISSTSNARGPIPTSVLSYFRAKLQDDLYSLIVRELLNLKDKLTRTEIARRIQKRPEQITRWLSSPGNWTLETVSDLCLAMDAELHFSLTRRTPIRSSPNVKRLTTVPSRQRRWMEDQEALAVEKIVEDYWPPELRELFTKDQRPPQQGLAA
jgi:DNA-binding phage protein